jgi:hypothetical protein
MQNQKTYIGIHNDIDGGMTPIGNIIRDAWVFGIIPENETCKGWNNARIDDLYDKVSEAWGPYGHLVSRLPDELRQRHARIYAQAVAHARTHGWDPELEDNEGS